MDRVDITQYKDIWVFAEQRQGKITPVVIELLGEGRKLADVKGIKLNAILLGKDVENLAQELISYGAEKVYLADDELLENYTTDGYTKVIVDAIGQIKPEIVLVGATNIGRDLAPRIASSSSISSLVQSAVRPVFNLDAILGARSLPILVAPTSTISGFI